MSFIDDLEHTISKLNLNLIQIDSQNVNVNIQEQNIPKLEYIGDVFNALHRLLNNFDIRFDIERFIKDIDIILTIPVTDDNWAMVHELFDAALLGCVMYISNNDLYWAKWIYNKLLWKKNIKYDTVSNAIYKVDDDIDYIDRIERSSESYITVKALYTLRLIFMKDSFDNMKDLIQDRYTMQRALIFLNETIDKWIDDPLLEPLFFNPIFCKIAAYNLTYHNCNNAFLLHEHGRLYRRLLNKIYQKDGGLNQLVPLDKRIKNTKPKIGFASRFLFQHSVGKVAIGIIEQLYLRDEFEIHVFTSYGREGDPYSEILMKSCHKYHAFNKEGQLDWVKAIKAENIDILIFLDTIMDINLYILACFKSCPIQIATWGHPDTSGLGTIDYFISSKIFEKNTDYNYTEKLIQFDSLNLHYYSPNKFLKYNILDMLKSCDKRELRQVFNFPDKHIYALTCPAQKISPNFEKTICRILENDLNGILIMTQDINPFHFKKIVKRFNANMSTDVCNRIYTTNFINDSETFYKFIYCADVVLDPFPFGGLISTIDIFSCGRAIITHPGNKLYGRYTCGLYNYMQIPKKEYLIADTVDDYIEKAIRIASIPIIREEIENSIIELLPNIFEDKATIDEWSTFLHCLET